MRLKNYLNEEIRRPVLVGTKNDKIELYKLWNTLNAKCKPIMKELRSIPQNALAINLLYRGMSERSDWVIKKVRKDRVPKDSPRELHERFDKAFENVFGVRARSQSLFATLNMNQAKHYGDIYAVFPTKSYKLIWSETGVLDLYSNFEDELESFYNEIPEHYIDMWMEEYDDKKARGEFGKNIISFDEYYKKKQDEWFEDVYMSQEKVNEFVRKNYKSGTLSEYTKFTRKSGAPEVHVITDEYIAVRDGFFTEFVKYMIKVDFPEKISWEEFEERLFK